ncbi:GDSL-type esterase/lipase family protein [uncultured Selenomonas sp.]|uniref:SGNH/GDSL hydrolase family protein n=1 Tax=uncultured Selenomonas sp. TaxID=159275 RepID=UPI0028DC9D22|nr:GDSL-type esterase/lipase family protein [uncultured Selenomonas sp.]
MKHYFFFTAIIFLAVLGCIFTVEKTDLLNLRKIDITAEVHESGGNSTLIWERLPYPCYYRIDTYIKTTGTVTGEPIYEHVKSEFTTMPSCTVSSAPIPFYYRITAYGMFGAVTPPSSPIPTPYFMTKSPIPISHYTEEQPASLMPFLVWHSIPNAVLYEVEILSAPPSKEGGTELSPTNHLTSTQNIFTNGWQADLRPYETHEKLYWRVRALGLKHEPIGEFSVAEPLYLDKSAEFPNRPIPNTYDLVLNFHQPIYPVYQWIPLNGVTHYEVELLTEPPTQKHGTKPDPKRVWAQTISATNAIYDEYARPYAGKYYWRVRGLDTQGNTVGTWSDLASFTVDAPPENRLYAAALGDSITHGGGAISSSPAFLEYSYTTYLPFACLNLGRSGDTAHTTLERFEQDVLPLHPANLLILTGSNSLRATGITAQDIIDDLNELQKKCLAHDIRPIFLTLLPLNPERISLAFHSETDLSWRWKMTAVNMWIRSQDFCIDIEPYFYDAQKQILDPRLSTDGLHPDIDGKRMMAEIINQHRNVFQELP